MPIIKTAYGKDLVRVVKKSDLPADPNAPHLKKQHISELTCRVLLFGPAFEPSFSKADNSLVVPTDTVKNTVYYLAKKSTETLENIELFAHTIATHFLSSYAHVEGVEVSIKSHNWTRLQTTTLAPVTDSYAGTTVSGKGDGLYGAGTATPLHPHPHSFFRAGDEVRTTFVVATRVPNSSNVAFQVKSGIKDLYVLKSTGSSFENYHLDALTTLQPASDRIFSTCVEANWKFPMFTEPLGKAVFDHRGAKPGSYAAVPYDTIFRGVKQITVDIFANHDSPSVQNTLFRMGEHILGCFPEVVEVDYALPNKHVFGYDLNRFGLQNTGKDLTVLYPVADPSGYIMATIGRAKAKL